MMTRTAIMLRGRTRLFALLCGAVIATPALCDDSSDLSKVKKDIKQLESALDKTQERRDDIQVSLQKSEKRIGKLASELSALSSEISLQQQQKKSLDQRQSQLNKRLVEQKALLAKQLKANAQYNLAQHSAIKLFLQQQDPELINRNLTYFRYFNQAQAEQIKSIQGTISELTANQSELDHKIERLSNLSNKKAEQRSQLNNRQSERKQILATLLKEEKDSSKRLNRLKKDEQELQRLIQRLDKPSQSPREHFVPDLPFHKLKGKLLWPANGKITNRFGKRRKQGKMRWEGIVISNKAGTAISAIAPGKVLFSDWMRGMGMLMIIDHGNGYMSLYAHNQSLYKEAGEPVEAGETIATMGNSGGKEKPALYFEIRKKNKPVNPAIWCKRG